jgi:hypothetical protein
MFKRIAIRLLAITLIVSMGVFAMQASRHWHGHSSDEQHCQICHVGHVAIPQPAAQMTMQSPVTVARFAIAEESKLSLDPVCNHGIPRAPPV